MNSIDFDKVIRQVLEDALFGEISYKQATLKIKEAALMWGETRYEDGYHRGYDDGAYNPPWSMSP